MTKRDKNLVMLAIDKLMADGDDTSAAKGKK